MRLELFGQMLVASSHSHSSGDPRLFGLVFFLSGFVFYGLVYRAYRNTDKRNLYESETEAKMLNVRAADQHVDTLTGLSNSKMEGANNHDIRGGNRGASGSRVVDALDTAMGKIPGGRDLLS